MVVRLDLVYDAWTVEGYPGDDAQLAGNQKCESEVRGEPRSKNQAFPVYISELRAMVNLEPVM